MSLSRTIKVSLCLSSLLLLVSVGQSDAYMSSVISKLKNVFSAGNKTTTYPNNNTDSRDYNIRDPSKNYNINQNTNQARELNYLDPDNSNHQIFDQRQPENQYHNYNNDNNNNDHKYDNFEYIDHGDYHQGTRDGDTRIPFWNIGHMVNSIEQVNHMLGNGSNGIEIDVSFNDEGVPIESYHGFPCDCGRHCHYRDNFIQMIRHIAEICVPPESCNLQLVLFDLKLSKLDEQKKIVAGEALARILHENLYDRYAQHVRNGQSHRPANYEASSHYANQNSRSILSNQDHNRNSNNDKKNKSELLHKQSHQQQLQQSRGQMLTRSALDKPPVRVVISINYVNDSSLIKSFMHYVDVHRLESMKKLIGFDVGMNDKLQNISSMWQELRGLTKNIWQGDGLTNCINLVRNTERLREAISMRNQQGHFRKVYYWTVDVLYQLRSILRLGPDAVLTNQPQRILQVLNEPEFKERYRLATSFDDPFAQYWIRPTASHMSIPTAKDAKETIENVKNTSMNFIKTLPDGITAAFKKVLSSATRKDTDKNQ